MESIYRSRVLEMSQNGNAVKTYPILYIHALIIYISDFLSALGIKITPLPVVMLPS